MERLLSDSRPARHALVPIDRLATAGNGVPPLAEDDREFDGLLPAFHQRQVGRGASLPNRPYRVPVVISGPGIAGPTLGPRSFAFDLGLAQRPGREPVVVSGSTRAVPAAPAEDLEVVPAIEGQREMRVVGGADRPGVYEQPNRKTRLLFGVAQTAIESD